MVLLQSNLTNRANSCVILPLIGEVHFNEESQISVENHEIAEELIALVPFFGFNIVEAQEGDEIQKKVEEDELNPKEEEDQIGEKVEEGTFEKQEETNDSVKTQLKKASLTELKEFAELLTKEDDSVKKSDWMKKNKSDLLEFLLEKVS